jgi:muconolactone delta-isomerase
MNLFMITIQLPKEPTQEFFSLIPKQRAKVDELMNEGKILHYSLSLDRSQLWVTIVARTETIAMDILSSFPMIHFMKPEISELAFHNSVSTELPKLIMN